MGFWVAVLGGLALGAEPAVALPVGRERQIHWVSEGRLLGAAVVQYKWDAVLELTDVVVAPDEVELGIHSFSGDFTDYPHAVTGLDTVKPRRPGEQRLAEALTWGPERFRLDPKSWDLDPIDGISLEDRFEQALEGTWSGPRTTVAPLLVCPCALGRVYLAERIWRERPEGDEDVEQEWVMEGETLRGVVFRNADDVRILVRLRVGRPKATASGLLTPVTGTVRKSRYVDEEGITYRRIRGNYRFTFDQRGQIREARYANSWVEVDEIAMEFRITDTITYTVVKLGTPP